MKRQYYGIAKRPWDALWHALWTAPSGRRTYDRVEKDKAFDILSKILK